MAGCIARARGRARRGLVSGLVAAATAAVLGFATAGCSGGPDPEFVWPDDPTGGPSATLDPAEAAAIEEVLAAFDGFRRTEVAIQADPRPAYQVLDQLVEFLADPLLGLALFDVQTMHERGVVRAGQPTWHPQVTELRLDGDPPTATVRDCLDATGWQLADRDGGGPTTAESEGLPARFAPDRYVMEFNARLIEDQWRFDEASVERDGQC